MGTGLLHRDLRAKTCVRSLIVEYMVQYHYKVTMCLVEFEKCLNTSLITTICQGQINKESIKAELKFQNDAKC